MEKNIRKALDVEIHLIVKKWRMYKNFNSSFSINKKLGAYSKNILLNAVVHNGKTIDFTHSKLGTACGIAYVIIKRCKTVDNSDTGRVIDDTHIQIDSVVSEDSYLLKKTLSNKSIFLGGVEFEIETLRTVLNFNKFCLNSSERPVGVLLHGPSGCGKTSLAQYVAQTCGAVFLNIESTAELSSGPEKLKEVFRRATALSEEGSVILFLDEIDSLCPRQNDASLGNKQLIGVLISEMDKLHENDVSGLLVLGATNFIASVHPSVRRPGRFDREILMNIPTKSQRISILEALTHDSDLSIDVCYHTIGTWTAGYVGADLRLLWEEAENNAYSKSGKSQDQRPEISMSDFEHALRVVIPSLQKSSECVVDLNPVDWSEIGGLEDVKMEIKQSIEWPLLYPEVLSSMDLPPSKGVLLYGPPGCCKTTLVKAAATSSHVTFLSLTGAQVYSPYVGESEKIISEAFQKARALSPSILFFDEIETLVGKRSTDSGHSRVRERILSTMLNEMDGIGIRLDQKTSKSVTEECGLKTLSDMSHHTNQSESTSTKDTTKSQVMVIGATNRLDMMDAAILRPGRLDKLIYVPPPDSVARRAILEIYTSKMPVSDINVDDLSSNTEYYTGADLKSLCKEAGLLALRESLADGELNSRKVHVKSKHFYKALDLVKPSLSEKLFEQYQR